MLKKIARKKLSNYIFLYVRWNIYNSESHRLLAVDGIDNIICSQYDKWKGGEYTINLQKRKIKDE